MFQDESIDRLVKIEFLKLSLISLVIIVGGITFAIFVPLRESLNWVDFIFYAVIGALIIAYFTVSFFVKTKKLKHPVILDESSSIFDEEIPVTQSDTYGKQKLKGQVLVDLEAVSFCPRCGASFTKSHRFCPNCGFIGILKKTK